MTSDFEAQKNIKAGSYTAGICAALFILFFFIRWTTPTFPQPATEDGIEVNLGNSDAGLGTDQPLEPGEPAPREQQHYTPPQPVAEKENIKDVETDDREEDAPVIKRPVVAKPDATKIADKDEKEKRPVKVTQPTAVPTPAPPKPKAVFKGASGNGTGGNEAETYKKGGDEGIAGGHGDQGKPGGDPDSKNYSGNGGTGKSGVSISRGLQGRRFSGLPSFEDDFNENAKVAVDIRVDETGKVTSAVYQPRGSTTGSATLKNIAVRKALQIKFNAGGEESLGTIVFNFRLKN